jgi:MFS family permease
MLLLPSYAGEVPAALLAGAAVDSIGRRITVGTGVLLTGLACCACSLLPPGWLTIALASAGKACCSGTWTVSYVYAAEIFPTYIRSVALAGTNQASRLGGIIAPGILYASEQMGLPAAAPFAAVGVAALLTAALLGLLPETMGQPQPDSVADLERLYGKQCSSSADSNSSNAKGTELGMWQQLKFKCFAAEAAGARQKGGTGQVCVGRQGSKLQRLLSRMSSSGSMGRHSSRGWAISAGWMRSSSSSSNGGSSERCASWHIVSTEDDSAWQQQQQQRLGQAPSVPDAARHCLADSSCEEAAVQSSDMEMGTIASVSSRQ